MKNTFLSIILCLFVYENGWTEKRAPELADLYCIYDVSEPDISPDGKSVVYTVYSLNSKNNLSISELWLISFDGKQSRQLTFSGENSNYLPKWSPDGEWISFLSDSDDEGSIQVWLISSHGGKPFQISYMTGDVSDYVWSPDSKQIALIASEKRNDLKKTQNTDEEVKPIVIDRYLFKSDGSGYLTDKRNHLFLLNVKNKKSILLTPGEYDESSPAWSPDGKLIAYVTKRGKDADRNFNFDIYLIKPEAGASEQQLTHYASSDMDPDWESGLSWSPDSSKIAYLRSDQDKWIYYAPSQLAVVNINNGTEHIISPQDKWFYKPKWSADGKSIYALVEESRNTYLNQINLESGMSTKLTHGLRNDLDFALRKGKIVLLTTDDTHPSELFIVESGLRQLTQHNKKLLDEVEFQPASDIQFKSFDGVEIDGLLMKPYKYLPGIKAPGILYLHGGPVYQFSHEFNFDFQWLAAKGYVVIAPNPRGSSGRGFEFAKAIFADWGNLDVKDVLAAVDKVVGMGIVDSQRLAVGGWSYGGMLTDYVIASDTRFKAALSGAGSANFLSSYGVDQYTPEYELELGKPWRNPNLYLKLSYPFMKPDRIKAATLFMCGQLDVNVPCIGSEQLYQELRSLGVPTQLVIYPDEYHTLSTPSFIVDRLQRYTDWLGKYLK